MFVIFAHGVNSAFDTVEEFVHLVPMINTATGRDTLEALVKCVIDMGLDLCKSACITTDGVPAMVEEK